MLIYFNARDKQSWKFMEILEENSDLTLVGSFPMEYSATSVVQDNRAGGMKTDYVLVLKKSRALPEFNHELDRLPGWLNTAPKMEIEK
jgi:hypothetical protein